MIAARYGTRGLAIATLIALGLALAVANGADGPGRVLETLAMPIELGALAARVLVGLDRRPANERRERRSRRRSSTSNGALPPTARRIGELRRGGAGAARAQRSPRSVADVPAQRRAPAPRRRCGGRRPGGAGADHRAHRRARGVGRDAWPAGELRSAGRDRDLEPEAPDRTALAALRAGQPVRALELSEGGPHDSDIAAPITDATGEVRGVVAARGVPGGGAEHGGASRPFGDRRLGVARHLRRRTAAS